jgi:hypothetical protein
MSGTRFATQASHSGGPLHALFHPPYAPVPPLRPQSDLALRPNTRDCLSEYKEMFDCKPIASAAVRNDDQRVGSLLGCSIADSRLAAGFNRWTGTVKESWVAGAMSSPACSAGAGYQISMGN